jgi:hypothetical protein
MSRAVPGTRTLRFVAPLLLAAAASGCMKGEVGGTSPPVITHPDLDCNTAPAAAANPDCRLQLNTEKTEYIQQSNDKDWWVVNVGDAPPARHRARGGGLQAGRRTGRGHLQHRGQLPDQRPRLEQRRAGDQPGHRGRRARLEPADDAGPHLPVHESNNDIFLLVQDDTGRKVDNLSPYSIFVEVVTDPDSNEPNDTPATATPITLSSSGGGVQGSNGGFLATPGDVDYFSIVAANPNSVMWIHVVQDCTITTCPAPHAYRLEYFLRSPRPETR